MPVVTSIPFKPEPITEMAKRINQALEPTYGQIKLMTLPEVTLRKHIFDFEDGMRAIISIHRSNTGIEEILYVSIFWPDNTDLIDLKENCANDTTFLISIGGLMSVTMDRLFGFPICLACHDTRPDMSMLFYGPTRKELQDEMELHHHHPNFKTPPKI